MAQVTPQRVVLFGVPFAYVTFEDVCRHVSQWIASRTPGYIVTPNVDHICRLETDTEFREAYARAGLVLVDGAAVLWAARWLGQPFPQKLSGSDLVPALCEYAAQQGYSVFFLGAAPGVGAQAAALLKEQYPGLIVAGIHSPPMGFYEDTQTNAAVLEHIQRANPDLCFVAMSAPQQEIWMCRHHHISGARVMIGVGAGLDFIAGKQKRAPRWMQQAGAEWLWRLCHEPRRLWRRYLWDDLRFVPIFWREFRRTRRKRSVEISGNGKDLGT